MPRILQLVNQKCVNMFNLPPYFPQDFQPISTVLHILPTWPRNNLSFLSQIIIQSSKSCGRFLMSQASSKIYLWMVETSLLLLENIFIRNPVVSKVSWFAHVGLQTFPEMCQRFQRCSKLFQRFQKKPQMLSKIDLFHKWKAQLLFFCMRSN